MNINSYEAKVIGIEKYKTIAKRFNLFTKSWTIGRIKPFKQAVKYEMKKKLKRGHK